MPAQFLPDGEKVTLHAQLKGNKVSELSDVEFIIFELSSVLGRRKNIEKVPGKLGPVKKGETDTRVATAEWTARGIEKDKLQMTVFYEVKAGDLKGESLEEIVIYTPQIEVMAKEDGSNKALPLVLCTLKVTPDSRYTIPDASPWKGKVSTTKRTDETGKTVFDNLPPGDYELSWRSPFSLVKWTKSSGAEREAQVKRGVKAVFVYPQPGKHIQYVNLPAAAENPEQGPALTVRAKVDPVLGEGRAGDVIYCKATYGDENSDRNDDPKPEFEGKPGTKKEVYTEKKELENDNGTVSFSLNLGVAGGDKVTLELGGTEACEDQKVEICTWRQLAICPVLPAADYPLPGGTFPGSVVDLVTKVFEPVYIKPVFEPAVTVLPDPSWDSYKLVEVGPDLAEKLGLPRGKVYFHKANSSPAEKYKKAFTTPPPDENPRVYIVLGYTIYREQGGCDVRLNFEMTSDDSGWIDAKGSILPIDPTGQPSFGYDKKWDAGGGKKGAIEPDWVQIDQKAKRVRLILPKDSENDPGTIASAENPVKIKLNLKTYAYAAGGYITDRDWIAVMYRGESNGGVQKFAYALLHELGHSMDQAAFEVKSMPGMTHDHPYHYGDSSKNDSNNHGHKGPHCRFGLPAGKESEPSYPKLLEEGIHGACIMYGGVGPKTDYGKTLQLCETCQKYFRAWHLNP
jgi:hypothetical protein